MGKDLSESDWEILPDTKRRDLRDVRQSIENSFSIVREVVEELAYNAEFSFEEVTLRLGKGFGGSVNDAFLAKIERLKSESYGHSQLHVTILRSLERFAGKNISFESITPEWLRRYEKFMFGEGKTRCTVSMYLRSLRAIINDAKRCGVIRECSYTFGPGKFVIQEGEGRKLALSLADVGRIARYQSDSPVTERYWDYWMFLYFCNGINIDDFIRLKYKDIVGGEICFIRQKTRSTTKRQKEIRAALLPQMQAIIEKWGNPPKPDNYIFPILDPGETNIEKIYFRKNFFTRELNKRIKVVSEGLGIGRISTYTARHSYATVLKRSGANIAYISETMGHNSLKTTEVYLASFESEERQKNAALLTQLDLLHSQGGRFHGKLKDKLCNKFHNCYSKYAI